MARVTELVDAAYLSREPPRPFPTAALPDLIGATLLERPLRALLDPLLLVSVGLVLLLVAARAHWLLLAPPLALGAWRVFAAASRVWRQLRDELALLRYGQIVRAHVLRLRPHRTLLGEIDGALLYCAIPVAPRRTYVGRVWLSDGTEALRLARAGRVKVICLPRTPGTWRIIEDLQSEVRYDHREPSPPLPEE
ncbi:MAG: hypothetical protein DIU80_023065 [Chloroflexota bacterium]|nr:MAG: hypothetical protein DIU80_17115 [Chloroflexota bacterium]